MTVPHRRNPIVLPIRGLRILFSILRQTLPSLVQWGPSCRTHLRDCGSCARRSGSPSGERCEDTNCFLHAHQGFRRRALADNQPAYLGGTPRVSVVTFAEAYNLLAGRDDPANEHLARWSARSSSSRGQLCSPNFGRPEDARSPRRVLSATRSIVPVNFRISGENPDDEKWTTSGELLPRKAACTVTSMVSYTSSKTGRLKPSEGKDKCKISHKQYC